jgi:hypothetical protein
MAGAAANQGQDVKLTAQLPVLLSDKYPTYQRWRGAFDNYFDCFAPLQAARSLPIDLAFAAYTAAQRASNSRCRLILQESLNAEDWDLVAGDARFPVNMHQLHLVYTGAAESDTELLQFELSNLAMLPDERLKAYWSRGISIRRRLGDLLVPVTDVTLLMWLLAGLPDDWKQFRAIAKHNAGANAGVYEMLRFLQPEETSMMREKLTSSRSSKSAQHSTLPSTHPTPLTPPVAYSAYAARPFTGSCWKCQQPGHRSQECPMQGGAASVCAHCGRAGHTQEKCFFLHGFPSSNNNRSNSRSRSPGRRSGTPGPSTPRYPVPPVSTTNPSSARNS